MDTCEWWQTGPPDDGGAMAEAVSEGTHDSGSSDGGAAVESYRASIRMRELRGGVRLHRGREARRAAVRYEEASVGTPPGSFFRVVSRPQPHHLHVPGRRRLPCGRRRRPGFRQARSVVSGPPGGDDRGYEPGQQPSNAPRCSRGRGSLRASLRSVLASPGPRRPLRPVQSADHRQRRPAALRAHRSPRRTHLPPHCTPTEYKLQLDKLGNRCDDSPSFSVWLIPPYWSPSSRNEVVSTDGCNSIPDSGGR